MTRAQFLNELYRRLPGLTQEQAEQHLTYYAEMLADRMEEGMSEEEAVASMEPVEVIAQRILQDEGVPEPEGPVMPPEYPNPPPADGSRFTKVPDMFRKKNWRKIAGILLWVVAIVMAVSTVGRWMASRGSGNIAQTVIIDSTSEQPPVDYGTYEETWETAWEDSWPDFTFDYLEDLCGLKISPDGIAGDNFYIGPEGIYVYSDDDECNLYIASGMDLSGVVEGITDEMVGARYQYENDTYRAAANWIDIQWTSGVVKVRGWDEDYIQFQEFSDSRLTQSQKLEYSVSDGSLYISNDTGVLDKGLVIWVPQAVLSSLTISSSSADIYVEQTAAEYAYLETNSDIVVSDSSFLNLTVYNISGGVVLSSMTAVTLDVQTSSGDVCLDRVVAEQADITTTSGGITGILAGNYANISTTSGNSNIAAGIVNALNLDSFGGTVTISLQDAAPERLTVDTTSGDVTLSLPDDWGFALEFDSASGYFERGPFSAIRMEDEYIVEGHPSIEIEVETTSGNLYLNAL